MRVQDEKSTDLAIERRGDAWRFRHTTWRWSVPLLPRAQDIGSVLVCSALVNSDILTVNYSVKQSQFTKLTSELRARNREESNEAFGRAIRK